MTTLISLAKTNFLLARTFNDESDKFGFSSQTVQNIVPSRHATHGNVCLPWRQKLTFGRRQFAIFIGSLIIIFISWSIFLVFLAFYAPTRGKIPSDVHQDRIKSITNLCCFPIHVGLVLEVSLMDVNHLRLFFGSEIPICLKVENILHILSKNASQVARNKLRWVRIGQSFKILNCI